MSTFNFKHTALAATAAALISPVAMADVFGGGATLPAKAYHGTNASGTADGLRLSTPAAGSLLGEALPGVSQTYCQVGSGSGRRVMTGESGNTANDPCPATFTDSFVNGANGFSSTSIDADFAGTDEPAGTANFDNFIANKGSHTQMVQFPSVAGAIAILANTPGSGSAVMYLTEAELCNVFAGKITRWGQLAQANGAPFGAANMPIKIVGRSDSSGTTFSFTNHMNWVCSDAALAQTLHPAANALPFTGTANFNVSGTYSPSFFPGGVLPPSATVVTGSGNPGVLTAINDNDGSIGYVEAANAKAAIASGDAPNVRFVKLAAVDTVAELNPADGSNAARNTALYVGGQSNKPIFEVAETFVDKDGGTYSGVYLDRALQSNNATFQRPIGVPTALTNTQAPNKNCVFIAHPGAYATSPYNTANTPSSGYKNYPIAGITYLLGNYALNGSPSDMEALFYAAHDTTLRNYNGGPVTSVGALTGYSYLTTAGGTQLKGLPLAGGALIPLGQNRINGCIN